MAWVLLTLLTMSGRDGWLRVRGGSFGLLVALAACSGQIAEQPGHGASPAPQGPDHGAQSEAGSPAAEKPSDAMAGSDATEPKPAMSCKDLGTRGAPVPMRRLNATQVERTVADVLGTSAKVAVTDEKLFTYRSNVSTSIDTAAARGYLDFAEAAAAATDLPGCDDAAKCEAYLLDDIAPRLFRRPLDDDQRARYRALYALGGAEGARYVLEALLQSPSFLYLDEVEEADGYLDDYSVAARMALLLWGSNPDLALLEAAENGELSTAAQVEAQAERMLADPRVLGGLSDFVDQWLELARLAEGDARPDLAELGDEVIAALRDEPVQVFRDLLERGAGLPELLTTSRTVPLEPLASIYSADILSSSADERRLDPARRAGLLSLPGVMAALSHAEATSPTLRGYAVLANFLCTPPPPPPAGVNITLPEVGPDATSRERLEAHFSDPSCGACHRSMDGLGFAFESIDWLGRSRDEEHGRAIDDASMFVLGGEDVQVDGVAELAQVLAASDAVAACVAKQWARYATGVPETADADCLLQRLGSEIREDGGLRQMMITYLGSDWFRRGRGEEP